MDSAYSTIKINYSTSVSGKIIIEKASGYDLTIPLTFM